jgi:hypothetical protein
MYQSVHLSIENKSTMRLALTADRSYICDRSIHCCTACCVHYSVGLHLCISIYETKTEVTSKLRNIIYPVDNAI